KNLDLVEVAAQADPPVTRVMDYGKYRYEQEQKAKLARKHQVSINVKEIKLRPKIGIHDYNTKKGHVERFLNQRAKVKVTIMFRGRETTHPERGRDLLMRLAEDVKEIGEVEDDAPRQTLRPRPQEAAQGAPRGPRLLGSQALELQARQGAGRQVARLRLPRPEGEEAHLPAALDHADQRRGAPRGTLVQPA